MPVGLLPKITFPTAAEVCQRYELEEDAAGCLRDEMSPSEFLDALSERELWSEAVKFLAQALPKRDAISWAYQCVRNGSGTDVPPATLAALQATEAWLADSSEDHRRAAHAAAEVVGLGTPAGCVALGVFFSGGSLGPKHLEHPIPPPDDLTGKALAGGLLIAAVVKEPENAETRFREFVEAGLSFARETAQTN